MRLRLLIGLAAAVLAAVVIVLLIPSSRSVVLGYVTNEPGYDNRPAGYWVLALKDPDPEVRRNAAFCLGQIGSSYPAAVPDLAVALKDESPEVRLNAALALFK